MAVTWQRVERAIKFYDEQVRRSLYAGSYDQHAADMRDLLTELSRPPVMMRGSTDVEYAQIRAGGYLIYSD